ncbi:MAG: hypothetical protein AAGI17_01390 [Planctomycetota bacterium]
MPDDPRPFDDAPDDVLERARLKLRTEYDRNVRERETSRLTRRIFVAFAMILFSIIVFFVVLPLLGIWLPVQVPLLIFGAIAAGAILANFGEHPPPEDPPERSIDGEAGERILRLPDRDR